jgi:hypothetical protein
LTRACQHRLGGVDMLIGVSERVVFNEFREDKHQYHDSLLTSLLKQSNVAQLHWNKSRVQTVKLVDPGTAKLPYVTGGLKTKIIVDLSNNT